MVELQNGEELLNYLRRELPYDGHEHYSDPDWVLLDINMPKVNGKQALKAIRQDLGLVALSIVMLM